MESGSVAFVAWIERVGVVRVSSVALYIVSCGFPDRCVWTHGSFRCNNIDLYVIMLQYKKAIPIAGRLSNQALC